jgi:hypothetical protein
MDGRKPMTITTKRKTASGHKITHLSICNGGKGSLSLPELRSNKQKGGKARIELAAQTIKRGNIMKTGKETIQIMIEAHNEKRKMFRDEIKRVTLEIDSMRSNAKNKEERERYLGTLKKQIERTEENIHELDSFDTVVEEYEALHAEIHALCDRKRELFFNPVIESTFVCAKRDGICCV